MISQQMLVEPKKRLPPKQYSNFVELSRDLRNYYATRNDILEQQLFPWWLHRKNGGSSKQYYSKSDRSKGIVICTGNRHFRLALVGLLALQLIGNELPIEIAFSTPDDLSLNNRQELKKLFPNIPLIDLSSTALNDSYLKLRGWEIKPFAVLASQFRQVLLMDSDVLFLEKPSILFDNPYYLKTGSLFFYDRIDLTDDTIRWIATLSADKNNYSIQRRTQDAAVVLLDKARVLTGLLAICKLNDRQEREQVTYRRLHGDKDTWWLGFHIIQMPFSFIPTLTGAMGLIKNTTRGMTVCGHMLHFDENYRPLWWNGAIFRDRYVDEKRLAIIEGWIYEGTWTLTQPSCLTNAAQTPKQFTQDQYRLMDGYRQITKNIYNIS